MAHVVGVQHLGEIGLVQHDANVLLDGMKGGALVIHPQHRYDAAVPVDSVHDQLDGGAFACAVLAYQAHNAAGGQRQVKTAQPEAGIFLCQTV